MGILKSFVKLFPGGSALTERSSYKRRKRKLEKLGDAEARFTDIYRSNKWKDTESVSGAGSSLESTQEIRAALPTLLDELRVKRLFDAPCGDYNWFRHVDRRKDVRYIGGDIVKALIRFNNLSFEDTTTQFVQTDITNDPLPTADLFLCRDCLIHLSFEDIQAVIENFLNSQIPYWLTTSHANVRRNIDIPTGHCRMLNLEIGPFNFPAPMRYIEDDDTEGSGKQLGLWEREALREALRK